nr:MAG TPA: hypothetical protein [Caudoviricetes sp.]DAT40086.1 MAG TPA: hypothetical protein [Caudoviricetes sp.]
MISSTVYNIHPLSAKVKTFLNFLHLLGANIERPHSPSLCGRFSFFAYSKQALIKL